MSLQSQALFFAIFVYCRLFTPNISHCHDSLNDSPLGAPLARIFKFEEKEGHYNRLSNILEAQEFAAPATTKKTRKPRTPKRKIKEAQEVQPQQEHPLQQTEPKQDIPSMPEILSLGIKYHEEIIGGSRTLGDGRFYEALDRKEKVKIDSYLRLLQLLKASTEGKEVNLREVLAALKRQRERVDLTVIFDRRFNCDVARELCDELQRIEYVIEPLGLDCRGPIITISDYSQKEIEGMLDKALLWAKVRSYETVVTKRDYDFKSQADHSVTLVIS
jgi:hypothetical protein